MTSRPRHPNHRDAASLPPELRRVTVPDAVLRWVAVETGSAVRRVRRLPGASSTAVHRLDLADGARLVLRRYVWPGFLEEEPIAPGASSTPCAWQLGGACRRRTSWRRTSTAARSATACP